MADAVLVVFLKEEIALHIVTFENQLGKVNCIL